MPEKDPHQEGRTLTRKKSKSKRPRLWRVVLHNDDYTTMEFVVMVLMKHFRKSIAEATQIMLQVHHKGSGIAGVFTRDVAETKVSDVMEEAESNGMPLKLTTEPE